MSGMQEQLGVSGVKMRGVETNRAGIFFKVRVWVNYGVIGLEIFYYMGIFNNMIIFVWEVSLKIIF